VLDRNTRRPILPEQTDDAARQEHQEHQQQEAGQEVLVVGGAAQKLRQHGKHQPADRRPGQRAHAAEDCHGDEKNRDREDEGIGVHELGQSRQQAPGDAGVERA
jgi:hypothetical protein